MGCFPRTFPTYPRMTACWSPFHCQANCLLRQPDLGVYEQLLLNQNSPLGIDAVAGHCFSSTTILETSRKSGPWETMREKEKRKKVSFNGLTQAHLAIGLLNTNKLWQRILWGGGTELCFRNSWTEPASLANSCGIGLCQQVSSSLSAASTGWLLVANLEHFGFGKLTELI